MLSSHQIKNDSCLITTYSLFTKYIYKIYNYKEPYDKLFPAANQ